MRKTSIINFLILSVILAFSGYYAIEYCMSIFVKGLYEGCETLAIKHYRLSGSLEQYNDDIKTCMWYSDTVWEYRNK